MAEASPPCAAVSSACSSGHRKKVSMQIHVAVMRRSCLRLVDRNRKHRPILHLLLCLPLHRTKQFKRASAWPRVSVFGSHATYCLAADSTASLRAAAILLERA